MKYRIELHSNNVWSSMSKGCWHKSSRCMFGTEWSLYKSYWQFAWSLGRVSNIFYLYSLVNRLKCQITTSWKVPILGAWTSKENWYCFVQIAVLKWKTREKENLRAFVALTCETQTCITLSTVLAILSNKKILGFKSLSI